MSEEGLSAGFSLSCLARAKVAPIYSETDRQTDRQTEKPDKQADRQTDGQGS